MRQATPCRKVPVEAIIPAALLAFVLGAGVPAPRSSGPGCASPVTLPAVRLPLPLSVTVTGYSSTPDQTDGDPFTAALGDDVRALRARGYMTVAVSRDLEDLLPAGTALLVADRMHSRWRRRMDIHFPDRGSAVRFGIRRGVVEVGR